MSVVQAGCIVPDYASSSAILSAPLRFPSGYVPVDSHDAATKDTVDKANREQVSIIYLSSAGSSGVPDGLTLSTAFSDFGEAVAAANAIVNQRKAEQPTNFRPVVIRCSDAGVFSLSADWNIVSWVYIDAPRASLIADPDRTLYLASWNTGINILSSTRVLYNVILPENIAPKKPLFVKADLLDYTSITFNISNGKSIWEVQNVNTSPPDTTPTIFNNLSNTSYFVGQIWAGAILNNSSLSQIKTTLNYRLIEVGTSPIYQGQLTLISNSPISLYGITATTGAVYTDTILGLQSDTITISPNLFVLKPYSQYEVLPFVNSVTQDIVGIPALFTRVNRHVTIALAGVTFAASGAILEYVIPDKLFLFDGSTEVLYNVSGSTTVEKALITVDKTTGKIAIQNIEPAGTFPAGNLKMSGVTVFGDVSL